MCDGVRATSEENERFHASDILNYASRPSTSRFDGSSAARDRYLPGGRAGRGGERSGDSACRIGAPSHSERDGKPEKRAVLYVDGLRGEAKRVADQADAGDAGRHYRPAGSHQP